MTEPYPTGDVLGSQEGEFFFYVVEPSSEPLELSPLPAPNVSTSTVLHSGRGARGEGRAAAQAVAMSTYFDSGIEGQSDVDGRVSPHPRPLSPDFDPWLKGNVTGGERGVFLHDADGFAGVDTITMSFLVSGRDPAGGLKHFARQIVLQGEELQIPEQPPRPPRRRAVRR